MICVINVTYKKTPGLEPIAAQQIVARLISVGIQAQLFCTSISGKIGDSMLESLLSMDGIIFYGLANVRSILDENQAERNRISNRLRELGFKGFIVAGGQQAVLNPEGILNDCSAVDYVLTGDPDTVVVNLVQKLLSDKPVHMLPGIAARDKKGNIRKTKPSRPPKIIAKALPHRPYLKWLLEHHPPQFLAASIESSHGCYHSGCKFCSTPVFTRKIGAQGFRPKPIEAIICEMEEIMEQYCVRQFIFEDDSFCVPGHIGEHRLKEFLKALPRLLYKPSFTMVLRPDSVNSQNRLIYEALRDAGLTLIYFGIESFCEDDLYFYNKGISLEHIIQGLEISYELGYSMNVASSLRLKPGFLPFHPYTKLSSIAQQITMMERYSLTPIKMIAQVEIYPGTPLYETVEKDGLLAPGTRSGYRFQDQWTEKFHQCAVNGLRVFYETRKQIRNIEKTVQGLRLGQEMTTDIQHLREELEKLFYGYFVTTLTAALDKSPEPVYNEALKNFRDAVTLLITEKKGANTITLTWREIYAHIIGLYGPYRRTLPEYAEPTYFRPCWFPVIH